MTTKLRGGLLVLLWCWSGPAGAFCQAAAPGSAATLEEINRVLAGAKTVFTHFVQERHLSLFHEPLQSEGYLCFEQPRRIRWEVTEPYRSILISDGSGVAQFEWVGDQWKKLDLGLAAAMQSVVSQIAEVMRGQYGRESRQYNVALANTDGGPVVTLVPRNEKVRKMIQAIEVRLAPDLAVTRQVVIREKDGDFTEIRFDGQFVGLRLPEGTFDRRAPLALEQIRQATGKGGR